MSNAGIVRNRLKIAAAINNAKACLQLRDQAGGLDAYLWQWVNGKAIRNSWPTPLDVPARTPLSDALSRDLAERGFKFVGSTIVYAWMQSIGLVDDPGVDCFLHGGSSKE